MKSVLTILICSIAFLPLNAQETGSTSEQQLENLAETEEGEIEDDSYMLQLERFKKHPVNLNVATADELKLLRLLTDLQINNLLIYRNLLGKLVHAYELQSIPTWDSATIQKVLPFIIISDGLLPLEKLPQRFKNGEHGLLFRYIQVLEKSKGFEKPLNGNTHYFTGSQQKLFFRYQYNYKNLLQFGILGDKDAGEAFLKNNQRLGFDFYSIHFCVRKLGIVKTLALGDFTVNLGQGLIQWQNMAFKKSAATLMVKRQAQVLQPYHSSGEYQFHRGAGITLQKNNWELTLFASLKKISANLVFDTLSNQSYISSILTSGYHRTISENLDRKTVRQIAYGGNLNYVLKSGHIGANFIQYRFSNPMESTSNPHQVFNVNRTSLSNASVDYGYTWRNIHFFGELAVDYLFNKAVINGMLLSASSNVDISILYRNIGREYRSQNANAFTENTFPVNENGFYTGLALRPFYGIRIDAYSDVFLFPWLKSRAAAPSAGKDYFAQLTYTPNKQLEMYIRYRNEWKELNLSNSSVINEIINRIPRQNMRWQTNWRLNNQVTLRNRVELLWYNKKGAAPEQGFLINIDAFYQTLLQPFAFNMRLQYVETDGFNSRIYAYENDLLYSYAIPAFYGKSFRYYFNFQFKWRRNGKKAITKGPILQTWLRWSQFVYQNQQTIGSGLDEIPSNKKSEIKAQILISF
jgi:hypothetical protein